MAWRRPDLQRLAGTLTFLAGYAVWGIAAGLVALLALRSWTFVRAAKSRGQVVVQSKKPPHPHRPTPEQLLLTSGVPPIELHRAIKEILSSQPKIVRQSFERAHKVGETLAEFNEYVDDAAGRAIAPGDWDCKSYVQRLRYQVIVSGSDVYVACKAAQRLLARSVQHSSSPLQEACMPSGGISPEFVNLMAQLNEWREQEVETWCEEILPPT
jgi:hypothetical protein